MTNVACFQGFLHCPSPHNCCSDRCIDDLELIEAIYRGRASQVCSALVKTSGEKVAVKMYRKKKLSELERYVGVRAVIGY